MNVTLVKIQFLYTSCSIPYITWNIELNYFFQLMKHFTLLQPLNSNLFLSQQATNTFRLLKSMDCKWRVDCIKGHDSISFHQQRGKLIQVDNLLPLRCLPSLESVVGGFGGGGWRVLWEGEKSWRRLTLVVWFAYTRR